jgi:hypothetical protein
MGKGEGGPKLRRIRMAGNRREWLVTFDLSLDKLDTLSHRYGDAKLL